MGTIAKRSEDITDEMWQQINKFNRDLVDEFMDSKIELSEKSKIQYESSLRIFFWWVHENLKDKKCIDIKKKEFIKYLNWLTNRGLSESAIKLKKSVISSFCNYIVEFYEEEYPMFRSFVTSSMKVVQTGYVHEKKPLTTEEYDNLCSELEKMEKWQILAWLKFSYSTGCRRAEARQLLKEVVNYSPIIKEIKITNNHGDEEQVSSVSYKTHKIRCKGRSVVGKVRQLQFSEDAMAALKKWIEVRGEDDCPYMFISKHSDGSINQINESGFNDWCSGLLTKLVGRRVHPHLLRESRATNIVVEEGKSIETAQKLLGHESSETTIKHYVIRDDTDDADEAFV